MNDHESVGSANENFEHANNYQEDDNGAASRGNARDNQDAEVDQVHVTNVIVNEEDIDSSTEKEASNEDAEEEEKEVEEGQVMEVENEDSLGGQGPNNRSNNPNASG